MTAHLPAEIRWLSQLLSCYTRQPIVADIGGGRGKKTSFVAQSNAYVVLHDINYYQEFRKITSFYGYNVDIIIADAQYLPLRDNAIDVAILWNLLMFVNDDKQVISRVASSLRDRAVLLLSTYDVRSGKKNYSVNAILKLLKPYFFIQYMKSLSRKQIKVIAIKVPRKKRYVTIRINVSKLINALGHILRDSYNKNSINFDKEAIILIPLKNKTLRIARYPWIRRSNFVSFSILWDLVKRKSFINIAKWLTKRFEAKCLYDSNEISKIISELNLNSIYVEKFANDLVRLGILAPATSPLLALEACEYIPSYKTVKRLRYTPHIIGCDITDPKCLVELIWNYNPVMRKVFITISSYTEISIELFRDIVRKTLAHVLDYCYGIRQGHKEHEMLKDINYVRKRIIEPLQYLNILNQHKNGKRLYIKYLPTRNIF